MLISNFPTFSYATWQGLIIISADKTPYVINDGNTDCKYVYWETANPYTLKATNDKLATSLSRFLIYLNDGGIASEVPQDVIGIQYREGSGVLISKIAGQVSELDGKYYAIKEDIDGLEKIIGSSGESESGSLVDRVNKIEQTAEGTFETISKLETTYNKDKESERLRDGISEALIAMATALGEYQEIVSSACEDFKITSEEKVEIQNAQNNFVSKANQAFAYHDTLVSRIATDENVEEINVLNYAKSNLQMAVTNLNTNVNTSISDNTVVPSEITIMLNMFGNIGVRANEYKETLTEAIVLGVGGEMIENVFSTTKTATEFNQRMANVTEVIDGETGLKVQIKANETNIKQTADDIKLNYVKYDKVTAEITVSDEVIKLDAGTVLMTGTLTWDSLDDDAKVNLKGDKGDNGSAEYVMLTGDQLIKYDAQGNASRQSILITALISGITDIPSIVWKYKAENSGEWKDIAANVNKTYYSLPANDSIWNGKDSITIRAIVNNIYYDDMTIVKVRDGIDGTLAEYVEINGDTVFKYTIKKGTTSFTPTPSSITLEGKAYNINTTNTRWYYKRPSETSWTLISGSNGKFALSISPDDTILFPNENDVVQIRFELNTHYDIVTITKLYDGQDSVMAVLSNESHAIPCKSDGTPTTYVGATTDLSIYVGSINDTSNWTISVTTDGVVGDLTNNNKTFTVTNILRDIGYVDFVAMKDDFDSVTKRFTISKSKNGLDGFLGKDSVSYWIIPSASAIIKKDDGSFNPSEIEFNAKSKEGDKEVTDHECIFKVYEKVNRIIGEGETEKIEEEWVLKYTSSSKENKCTYKITSPNEIKVCLCNDDGVIVIDEEHIPMLTDGEATPVAFLDNDSHVIPCNFNGVPLNYEGATTTMHVYTGSVDDSDNWRYTISQTNVNGTATNNNRTYTVTSISSDTAYVDFIAQKEGFDNITRRFTITKAINGTDGESAKYVHITGEQVFKYSENFSGTPTPENITLTATRYNINTTGEWQYKDGTNYVKLTEDEKITINPTMGTFGSQNTSTFRYITKDGYYDEITIIKISDGTNGLPGSDGEDSIYILLTNENHSIPCDSEGNYTDEDLAKAATEIHVYKGLEEVNFRISELSYSDKENCHAEIDGNIVRLTSLNVNSATITISIMVENKVFTKVMSVSKALQGGAGSGINVQGTLADIGDLPTTGSINDAYLIDGKMYIWSNTENKWVEGATVGAIKGEKGQDGRTTYFHIKYSNDGGKTFTENNGETVGDWIGFYTDFYEEDSTVVTDYEWKKIKGEQGENGIVVNLANDSHVIPCKSDGTTDDNSFLGCETKISLFLGSEELDDGISYDYEVSDNSIGVEWFAESGTCKVKAMNNIDSGYITLTAYYNGVGYSKKFTITKSKQGEDAITINLSNDNHSFIASSEGKVEVVQSAEIQVTAFRGTTPVEFEIGGLPNVNGLKLYKEGSTKVIIQTDSTTDLAENGTINIPIVADGVSFTKQFTYTRVDSGKDGTDGLDAYTVYLTNETHSFYCESNGTVLDEQSTVTTVKAFLGTVEKTPTIGTINSPTGLTITKNDANITIKTDGKNLASNGSFNIPITIDGKQFIKVFSWTKAFKGQDGQNGESAKYVVVSGDQVFKYSKGSTVPTPRNIALNASCFGVSSEKGKWQYKYNNDYIDLGVSTNVLTVTPSSGTLADTSSCTFRYIVEDVYDEITVVEVSDGIDGNQGQTFYTWIMYADDANGKNISNNPTNKTYIGLSYNNESPIESTDPTKYQWSLIKGTDGVEGARGEDGITYYTWIKYSDYADGSSMYDTAKADTKYIGIAVNKTSQTESTNKSDYRWSQFRGDDGVDGDDAYTVILTNESHSFVCESSGNIPSAISTTCQILSYKGTKAVAPTIGTITNPSGMTITKSGTTLTITVSAGTSLASSGTVTIPVIIDGITFNRTFSWTKTFKGVDAIYVIVSGQQAFKYPKNSTTPTPSTITLTATRYNTNATGKWQYKSTSGTWVDLGITALSATVQPTTGTLSSQNYCTFRYIIGDVSDEITLVKLIDGNDAYTIVLTNETHSFLAESNGNITSASSTTCQVIAYKGTTSVTPTIGTLPTVAGLTLSKSGTNITIKANTGTSLANSGSFNIPITIDGMSFNKTFSWVKVLKGEKGDKGVDAEIPNWITEWDSGKTTINNTTVLAPKIFAGSVTSNKPTGVALGVNVFGTSGTYSNISGIAGYKDGTKTYHFNTDGSVLLGSTSGKYISWDGSNLKMNVTSLSISANEVATVNAVNSKVGEVQNSVDGVATRVTSVENKVTSDAIVRTVTSSTTWTEQAKDISTAKSDASSAKSTASANAGNISTLVTKVSNVEEKVTADAIVRTMTQSTSWSDLNKEVDTVQATVTESANKLGWLIKSGTSQSSMTLTDKMYELISNNVTIKATKIKLEGYTTVNGNFKIDTSGNMTAKNGTFSGNISASNISGGTITGTKIIGQGSGNRILINNGDYEIQTGSTTKGFLGIRTLDDGYEACRLALSSTGLKRANDNYIVIQPYNKNANPQSYAYPYVDIAYRCHGFAGEDGVSDVSNLKMYGDGVMRLSPIKKLEITTNFSGGAYAGSGERDICQFGSSSSEYYPVYLDLRGCIRNHQSNHGLIISAKGTSSGNTFNARAVVYQSDGFRTFAPVRPNSDGVPHYLGSGSYRWQTVYAVNSLNTSSDRTLKENIKYLSEVPNMNARVSSELSIYDMYDFIRNDLYLVSYNWIEDPEKEEKLGFIAQDILDTKVGDKLLVCNRDRDDTLGYDSGNFEATIAGALKVNIIKSEVTKGEVDKLKAEISELKEVINELKNIIDKK